ncbi:MAG: hypothetical protein AAGD01_08375 [Acidobacteriota bacterium]
MSKLGNDQIRAACKQFDAFLNQVEAFGQNGTLSATEAHALPDEAIAIQAATDC